MAAEPDAAEDLAPRGTMRTIFAIGLGQILGWGSVFYLMAVIARPVAEETGWTYTIIISGLCSHCSLRVSPRRAWGGSLKVLAGAVFWL